MKPEAGFTLVEALVAGLLSSLVAMAIFTVFQMNSSQIRKSSSHLRLAEVYDVVSGEIHRATYRAASARPADCNGTGMGEGNCGVIFYDAANTILGGFRVLRKSPGGTIGIIEEASTPALDWQPLRVAANSVEVSLNVDDFLPKITGVFNVYDVAPPFNDQIQGVRFNLRLDMTVNGIRDSLPMQTESSVCRNSADWKDP